VEHTNQLLKVTYITVKSGNKAGNSNSNNNETKTTASGLVQPRPAVVYYLLFSFIVK